MKVHEYQAKQILREHNVHVSDGRVIENLGAVKAAYDELGGGIVAIKAQIHAGGRGKGTIYDGENPVVAKKVLAGGVKIAKSSQEVSSYVTSMLGGYLHTIQTGSHAKKVSRVYLEKGTEIKAELYLSILLDRSLQQPVFIVSQEGGMDIEEVAAKTPDKILKFPIEANLGLQAWQARAILFALAVPKEGIKQGVEFLHALWNCYIKEDASLLEINPLVINGSNELVALDCKFNLDDNAHFRIQKNRLEMRDIQEEDPLEVKASQYNLNYIRLEGNVGCMVNGAGLAMATMDIIKLAGAEPANFLDVGGGANVETVSNGFRIILEDPNVKAIFINIFGGIVQCDRVANGIVEAAKKVNIRVPMVVRLQGTNAAQAGEILAASGVQLAVVQTLEEGARQVAAAIA